MDITLERILSLIPKKQNGKYLHGAKKAFGESIGYVGGEIVTMWEKGSSKSYMGKIYEISSIYNVSVEWLRGETDDPSPTRKKEKPPAQGGGLSGTKYDQLTPENREFVNSLIDKLFDSQSPD